MMAVSTPIFGHNVIVRMSTDCQSTSILERVLLQDEALKVQFKFNHALLPFDIAEPMFFWAAKPMPVCFVRRAAIEAPICYLEKKGAKKITPKWRRGEILK